MDILNLAMEQLESEKPNETTENNNENTNENKNSDNNEELKTEDMDTKPTSSNNDVDSDDMELCNTDDEQEEERKRKSLSTESNINTSEVVSADSSGNTSSAPVLMPSLRGTFTKDGNGFICRGKWAMSDSEHGSPEKCSAFEFRLVKGFDDKQTLFPIDGRYLGWFSLKQPALGKSIKIDDKDMIMKFLKLEDGSFSVEGTGSNKFGSFTLNGKLDADLATVQLYREYVLKPVPAPPSSSGGLKRKLSLDATSQKSNDTSTAQREGGGRLKKQSAYMREYSESLVPKPPVPKATIPKSVMSTLSSSTKIVNNPIQTGNIQSAVSSGLNRSQRIPSIIVKCAELLKEMQKHPQGIWFLEPVDYVKLNILDYPQVVTKPMDFSTISHNIEKGQYEQPEQFADHMRLVFRNAITYNHARDHPVHIAARDLNAKFEEKYRTMISNYQSLHATSANYVSDPDVSVPTPAISKPNNSSITKKPSINKFPRNSNIGGTSAVQPSSSKVSPRYDGFIPAPVVDTNTATIIEMQRKMEEMARDIAALKKAIRQNEVLTNLETQRSAAHDPLTLEEKKLLIEQIHKLPPEKMDHVVEIITAAMKNTGQAGEDIEVPLDELDSLTLRKLQKYVEECNKKRRVSSPRANGERTGPKERKPRNSQFKQSLGSPLNGMSQIYDPLTNAAAAEYALEEDELLFDADALEEDTANEPVDAEGNEQKNSLLNESAWNTQDAGTEATNEISMSKNDSSNSDPTWNGLAAEVLAKQQLEQQRKADEERLSKQKAEEAAKRIEELKQRAEQSEQLEKMQHEQEAMDTQKEMELLLQKKEEERLERERQKQMTLSDDKDDDLSGFLED